MMKKITIIVILMLGIQLSGFAQEPTYQIDNIAGASVGDIVDVQVFGNNFQNVCGAFGYLEIVDPSVGEIISWVDHTANSITDFLISPVGLGNNIISFTVSDEDLLCDDPIIFGPNGLIFTVQVLITGTPQGCFTVINITPPFGAGGSPLFVTLTSGIEVVPAISSGSIQLSGGCDNLFYEPNETCSTAAQLSSTPLENGESYTFRGCLTPGDVDYFQFTTENGETYFLRSDLSDINFHGGYILEININEDGNCITVSTNPSNPCQINVDTQLELFSGNDCSNSLAYNDNKDNTTLFSELEYCMEVDCICVNAADLVIGNLDECDVDLQLGLSIDQTCGTLASGFTWNIDGQTVTENFGSLSYTFSENGIYDVSVSFDVMNNTTGVVCNYMESIQVEVTECGGCENLPAPTNLTVNGTVLQWDPVPGAVSYIISSPGQGPQITCPGCSSPSTLSPIATTDNFFDLANSGLRDRCFVWQVTAVCADGSQTATSSQSCYPEEITGKTIVVISPNPTSGKVTFDIETHQAGLATIDIYRFDGHHIQRFEHYVSSEGRMVFSWEGSAKLTPGLYYVKVSQNGTVQTEKLIVK